MQNCLGILVFRAVIRSWSRAPVLVAATTKSFANQKSTLPHDNQPRRQLKSLDLWAAPHICTERERCNYIPIARLFTGLAMVAGTPGWACPTGCHPFWEAGLWDLKVSWMRGKSPIIKLAHFPNSPGQSSFLSSSTSLFIRSQHGLV